MPVLETMRDEKEMMWIFAGLCLLAIGAFVAYGSYIVDGQPSYNVTTLIGAIIAFMGAAIFIKNFVSLWKLEHR